jgi:hypothetical protein
VRKAIAQAREELDMLFGRLRGEVFRQLSEHARALGAELSRHHDDLATDLKRAIERGSRLIANNESERNEREDQLREALRLLIDRCFRHLWHARQRHSSGGRSSGQLEWRG